MQQTVTSFSKALSLCAILAVASGCGGAQEVRHTGGMSQEMQIGVSDELTNKIKELWQKVFGRAPTDDEATGARDYLASGNTMEMLRYSLANSTEAREKIRQILSDAFGGDVNTGTVDLWIQALGDRISLEQIRGMLSSPP